MSGIKRWIMKKKNIVQKSREFTRIITNNKAYKYKDYVIYIERTTNDEYRFGVSVSKKLGNAVLRNKLKRQIKTIISKKDYQKDFNCIIILGRGILDRNYQEMEENLFTAFGQLDMFI